MLIAAAYWAVLAVALLWPGGLSITKHTGDALHMVAIVERLAQGQLPHLDFMSPIGILAFWPIAVLVKFGLSVGQAFVLAQVLVGAGLAAIAFFVIARRLEGLWPAGFAALVLILSMALVHGEAEIAVSVSMHYNRWAWALAFIVLAMAALPVSGGAALDGVIMGALMVALVLVKVTYVAVLAPLVILGLLITDQRMTLAIALPVGLLILAVLTAVLGVGFLAAYIGDLLAVARSDVRAQPGLDFSQILTAPAYLAWTIIAFVMVVVLRRGGFDGEGILVLALIGAGGYITYQNFGNDPQWLALLAFLLAVWAAEAPRSGARPALLLGAAALSAMIAPSFINMAISPFRHLAIDRAAYMPALTGAEWHQDLYVSRVKANRLRADTPLSEGVRTFNAPEPGTLPEPAVFRGETLPDCRTEPVPGYFASITADLEERGLAQGASIFAMDILNPYWLYGDHRPLARGTPWYYSGLPGFEDAEYVLLPACPVISKVRNLIAEELKDVPLEEVAVTPLYTLYAR